MSTSESDVLDRLAPETEPALDWEWVLSQVGIATANAGHEHAVRRRPVLLALSVVVAVTSALVVVAPWKGGPTILQRANAAISPAASQVLYMNFGVCCPEPWRSGRDHTQLWVEGASPRSFRSVGQPRFGYSEHGGTLGPETSLGTQPVTSYIGYSPTTNTIVEHVRGFDNSKPLDFDPLTVIRKALAAGTAKLDGRTVVDGEPAIQIALTTSDLDGHTGTLIYVVNAKTYHPIEIKYQSLAAFSAPLEPIFRPDGHGWTLTLRFQTFEYLDNSAQNLALASIRAQHPKTRIIRCNGYKCAVIQGQPKGALAVPAHHRPRPSVPKNAIPQKEVPRIAPSVRSCMLAQGATSVTANHPGGTGGIARFPGAKQPLPWSWVGLRGKAWPVANPMGMLPARDRSPVAVRERHAVATCLLPYLR